MGVTDKFADEFLQLQVDLMRVEAGTRRQIIGLLKKLEIALVAQIERFDLEGVKRTSFKFKRLDALLQQTRATISTAYKGKAKLMSTSLVDIAKMQSKELPRIFARVLGGSVLTTALTPGDLRQLVRDSMIRGAPSRDWWAKQGTDLQQSFMVQMRMGVAGGETNQQLVARLRGAATGRRRVIELANGKKRIVPEFSGGIMDVKTREAEALVRTSVQSISNNVIEETYQNNQDVLKGREWLSTLDDRTTPFCIAHDGGAWDFDGNPLPESTIQVPFPGVPPDESHWGCRSTLIPITKSWDELAEMSGSKVRGIRESIADSERASMDGRVSGRLKYSEWLKAKDATDPAAVRHVLGPGRYDLWKKGKITTAQLIDQTGRPLTVKQLEALKGGPKLKPPPVQPKPVVPPTPPTPLPPATPARTVKEIVAEFEREYERLSQEWLAVVDAKIDLKNKLALPKGFEVANVEVRALEKKRDLIRDRQRNLLSQVLNPDGETKAALRFQGVDNFGSSATLPTQAAEQLERAKRFLEAVVPRTDNVLDVKVFARTFRGRPYVMRDQSLIVLFENNAAEQYVHEVGHLLEFHVPGWHEKILKFRAARHAADPRGLRPLNKMEARPGWDPSWYRPDEMAVEDKWHRPYLGKVYSKKSGDATEVLSMGLEMLFDDPTALLKNDREFFEFLIDLLTSVPR